MSKGGQKGAALAVRYVCAVLLVACAKSQGGPSSGEETGGTEERAAMSGGTSATGTGGTGAGGMTGLTGGMTGPTGGSDAGNATAGRLAGMSTSTSGGTDAGSAVSTVDAGTVTGAVPAACCADGGCICRGAEPTGLTSKDGPYDTSRYYIDGAGCVTYPTDAKPPFAAVAFSEGFLGSGGGCSRSAARTWGPFYASWGIVAIDVEVESGDQPEARGQALLDGVAALKAENEGSGSRLSGLLAGRYGTSGFSMGGGGVSYAAQADASLLSSVMFMPWGLVTGSVEVPTLIICGASDKTAACESHGGPFYESIAETTPKMRVTISSGHAGTPSAGRGDSAKYGLAFQKVFLEGDDRWRPFLVAAESDATNIE